MIIGITDSMGAEYKYQKYVDWVRQNDPSISIVRLSYTSDNLSDLERCHGVILTGGGDVDPTLYNGNASHSKLYGVDRKRDDFEFRVIEQAMKHRMPLLGICRGLQTTNVFFGGTLIEDLEEIGHSIHETHGDKESRHGVTVEQGSQLGTLARGVSFNVNSYHHQAAEKIGKGLRVTAKSEDGIVEGIELEQPNEHSFFLLVQWHPERMSDVENPLCGSIRQEFLKKVEQCTFEYKG